MIQLRRLWQESPEATTIHITFSSDEGGESPQLDIDQEQYPALFSYLKSQPTLATGSRLSS